MDLEIYLVSTDNEINACFPAFKELRPKLEYEELLPQVRRQENQSYKILALRHNGEVKCVAGFRYCEFLAWGKIIYIDDLSTIQSARGNGYAGLLLDWLIEHAKSVGIKAIHLDSGYARNNAHRLYLKKGFNLSSHHFSLEI